MLANYVSPLCWWRDADNFWHLQERFSINLCLSLEVNVSLVNSNARLNNRSPTFIYAIIYRISISSTRNISTVTKISFAAESPILND